MRQLLLEFLDAILADPRVVKVQEHERLEPLEVFQSGIVHAAAGQVSLLSLGNDRRCSRPAPVTLELLRSSE